MKAQPQYTWVKLTRETIVAGKSYHPGTVLEVTLDTAKQLLRDQLAIPTGEKGRMLTTTGITTDFQQGATR